MLLLLDQKIEVEVVYADHGTDWPETRSYVDMLIGKGYPITILETRRDGLNLYDYYYKHRFIPLRFVRACTRLYKLAPLNDYIKTPCIVYIGIDAAESHRATKIIDGQRDGEEKLFPLIDEGLDRKACIKLIEGHGLPSPIKSGCYICPFMGLSQWRELRTKHPDLYCKAKSLEIVTNKRLAERGTAPIYFRDKPLDQAIGENQLDLFGERDAMPCLCML
jgi:3'-phosphoadenosine 5'-phosphosulfate sulfotransferase (PAPS reductase)/FAD synthetase